MKKSLIWIIIALLLITSTQANAAKLSWSTTVDNLQPRTSLEVTANPYVPPRKIDLVIDSDITELSSSKLNQLVKDNIEPLLKSAGIDYKISYYRPPNYTRDPIHANEVITTSSGRTYVYKWSNWHSRTVPNNASIIASSMRYYLDDKGNVYEINYYAQFNLLHANTNLVALFPGVYGGYGADAQGNLYTVIESRISKIDGITQVVDAVGDLWGGSVIAARQNGEVWGRGYDRWTNPHRVSGTTRKINGLSNIKDVEIFQKEDESGYQSAYAIDHDGVVYSWGGGYLGRSSTDVIGRIDLDEPAVRIDTSAKATSVPIIITASGKRYSIFETGISLRAESTPNNGVIKGFRIPDPTIGIAAARDYGATFSNRGDIVIWGGYSSDRITKPDLPYGESAKQIVIEPASSSSKDGVIILTESGNIYHAGGHLLFRNDTEGKTIRYSYLDNVESIYYGGNLYAITREGKLYRLTNSAATQITSISNAKQIVTGRYNSNDYYLLLDRNGDLWHWGANGAWSLSTGGGATPESSPNKLNLPFKVKQISAAGGVVAALDEHGDVWTWGAANGAIGTGHGHMNHVYTPTKLSGIPKIAKLAVSGSWYDVRTMLMVGTNGKVYGWGDNPDGLVDSAGSASSYHAPIEHPSLTNVVDIALGYDHALVLRKDGTVYAWADNTYGKLGRNSSESRVMTPGGISAANYPQAGFYVYEHLETRFQNVSWRNGAEKYYLQISDTLDADLQSSYWMSRATSALLSQGIAYIGMTSSHVEEMSKLVAAIDARGKVIRKTGNFPLHLKHAGQYIVKKQPVDVVFHIGNTTRGTIEQVRQLLELNLVPQVEQYGIEMKLTVTDGERIPENRIFYVDNGIRAYDPLTGTSRRLVSRNDARPFIHHTGDLFYLVGNTIYRYDPNTETESVYHTFASLPYDFTIDRQLNLWYSTNLITGYYYLYKIDKTTGLETVEASSPYYGGERFSHLAPRIDSGIFYNTYKNYQSYIHNENGCIYYQTTDLYFKFRSTCSDEPSPYVSYATGLYNADRDHYFYTYVTFGYDSTTFLMHRNGRRALPGKIVEQGEFQILTVTPDGRLYYKKGNTTHWYNWRTGERGTTPAPASLNPGSVIPYRYINEVGDRKVKSYTLSEGLDKAMWRTGSDAYYVYMNDGSISDLNAARNKFWDDKVSFIGFGSSSNQSQINTFISSMLDGNGTFMDTANLGNAISELAAYIISHAGLPKYQTNEDTIILEYDPATSGYRSGDLIWNPNYEDIENDPQYKEQWVYLHNPAYYENPLGTLPEHGQTLTSPLTVLTRTGKYDVTYETSDRPKADSRFAEFERWSEKAQLTLYAHRRPIADFSATISDAGDGSYNLVLVDRSYDPDRQSKANRGIAKWEWKWKRYEDAGWTLGTPPSKIGSNSIYLISLRVKDEDGAWSDEKIITLLAGAHNNAPIAKFTVTSQIHYNQEYTIVDQSFDPDGDPIAERRWEVAKDGKLIYEGASQPTAATLRSRATSNGLSIYGAYDITLTVRDNPSQGSSLWSQPYTQSFTIINQPPVAGFTWTPSTLYQGNSVQVKHAVNDPEKATLSVRYQVTAPNGQVTNYPSSGSYSVSQANYSGNAFTISNLQGGNYTIVQTVSDGHAAAVLTKTMYAIPNRPPVADFTWTPSVIWEGDTVSFTNLSHDPDGDTLTSEWAITYPDGGTYISRAVQPAIRLAQPGHHTVKLTVSDGRLSASRTKALQVRNLTLAADVHHTEQWLAYHREAGHETMTHPKDFYSGEKFILTAITEAAPVRTVTATLTAADRQGATVSVTVTLNLVHAQSYQGEIYEERFSSLDRGLATGTYTIRFQVEYMNGTTKTADVPIRIIGHVLESVGVHRRR